ncbi:MAG: ester cyclase [Pseudomonadota bacterium]
MKGIDVVEQAGSLAARDAMRAVLEEVEAALYDDMGQADRAGDRAFAADALVRMCAPFGDLTGWDGWWERCLAPLAVAMPDVERRVHIRIAGPDEHGGHWIGGGGYYLGTLERAWMDIPATGRVVHMRFHEFFRIEGGQVVEAQVLWDIPEVMMQARAWPLAPSLGRDWHIPGPATCDGLGPHEGDGAAAAAHVVDMLTHLKKHPSEGGPEVMEMDRFWHPKMTWYGPAGIGTGRGIEGFRRHHQIPFLGAMPDRGQYLDEIVYHFMAEGAYVGVTGWPNMVQTLTHGGWMGIAPAGRRITMRSLDFWRLEGGLIRENWVLVDLLDVYDQLGVDVWARMRELVA